MANQLYTVIYYIRAFAAQKPINLISCVCALVKLLIHPLIAKLYFYTPSSMRSTKPLSLFSSTLITNVLRLIKKKKKGGGNFNILENDIPAREGVDILVKRK